MSANKANIILRAIEPEDIDLLYQWENDRNIWQVSNTLTPFSKFILTKYIETAHLDIYQTRQLRLMIDLLEENNPNKTIGAIDIFDFEPFHHRAGVGILIHIKYRGKGYSSLALEALVDYAFNVLQLKQLYCNIGIDNNISINLFKKYGFEEIGVKKMWNKTQNGYTDEVMLQLINTTF